MTPHRTGLLVSGASESHRTGLLASGAAESLEFEFGASEQREYRP